VQEVIRLVHIDRLVKLADMKRNKKTEYLVIEFRKWISACKKKMKKDPVHVAKCEITKVSYAINYARIERSTEDVSKSALIPPH